MNKVFIRTLDKSLWINSTDRENIRIRLNTLGFYTLTGIDDTLVVYAFKEEESWVNHFGAIIVRMMQRKRTDLS